MKGRRAFLACLWVAFFAAAARADGPGTVGVGRGIAVPDRYDNPCPGSALCLNYDGTAENGYCWGYVDFNIPPYWGAFAECCSGQGCVCGIELHLTSIGYPCIPCDLYVWSNGPGDVPDRVLTVLYGADPCPVAIWPQVSTHDFAIPETPVDGRFWIGYWGDFAERPCSYFVAADLDGPGGCPYTNIAPGFGYPSGWHDVSIAWGPTQALGIGAWTHTCGTPTRETSWGRIKGLYHD